MAGGSVICGDGLVLTTDRNEDWGNRQMVSIEIKRVNEVYTRFDLAPDAAAAWIRQMASVLRCMHPDNAPEGYYDGGGR